MKYKFVEVLCWLLLAWQPVSVSAFLLQRESTQDPHGSLAIPCENCHRSESWRPIKPLLEFDHNKTHYLLRGMHRRVTCRQCHTSLIFADVGKNCSDCHADIHLRKFGADCAQCHIVQGWFTSLAQVRNHQNLFPLIGAHAAAECEACHKSFVGGQYRVLPYCSACHLSEFKKTTNPNHIALNFPETCDSCHSQDSWLGAKFAHQQFTSMALTGIHATLDCQTCHAGGKYKGTSSNCYDCHAKEFHKTSDPSHIASGFSTACSTCHGTATWIGATSPQIRTPLLRRKTGGGD